MALNSSSVLVLLFFKRSLRFAAILEFFWYPSLSCKKQPSLWPEYPLEQIIVVSLASLCVGMALELLEEISLELLETASELLDGASLELVSENSELLAGFSAELLVCASTELLEGCSLPLLWGAIGKFSLSPPQLAQNRVVAENKSFFQYLLMFMNPPNSCLRNTSKIYFF